MYASLKTNSNGLSAIIAEVDLEDSLFFTNSSKEKVFWANSHLWAQVLPPPPQKKNLIKGKAPLLPLSSFNSLLPNCLHFPVISFFAFWGRGGQSSRFRIPPLFTIFLHIIYCTYDIDIKKPQDVHFIVSIVILSTILEFNKI